MPQALHNKIKADLRKAHPRWSEAKLESATNGTMANIAKRSRKVGTFPGRGRRRAAPRKKK
jgi:hypothetical protein